MVKDPNMFVRTHVVYYFVSLLLSDVLQGAFRCIPSIICAPFSLVWTGIWVVIGEAESGANSGQDWAVFGFSCQRLLVFYSNWIDHELNLDSQ